MISEETKQKITQVAETCIRCRRCMKECLMLNRFAQNPKVLFTQYLEEGPENMDRRIAYSCNECSQCTLKCPKDLNLKAVFQALKEDYAAENHGIVPVEALIPSEFGQSKECSPEFCTTLTAGNGHGSHGRARYLFVPGRFPADPILRHLRGSLGEHNVDLLPYTGEDLPGEKILSYLDSLESQVLITACPSSFQALRRANTGHRVLFYWDLMQDLIGIPQEAFSRDGEASLLLRSTDALDDSIRWVLDQLDCSWQDHPPKQNRSELETADRNCRQILGLLFGADAMPADRQPFPRHWHKASHQQGNCP